MFVFLLHQKYTLYSFLTEIDTKLENDLRKLEEYKKRLSDFKTYFVFSRISEVINYQLIYSEVGRVFSLGKMFEDVEEPLEMLDRILSREAQKSRILNQVHEEEAEKKRSIRDSRLNLALATLSLLGIISAFNDLIQFSATLSGSYADAKVGNLVEWLVAVWPDHSLHIILCAVMTALIIGVILALIIVRRKEMKQNCLYYGVFFRPEEVRHAMKRSGQSRQVLEREIEQPHVTVAYKPSEIPFHLFGETVRAVITGYGADAQNEGVSVVLHSDNTELNALLDEVAVPHITLSISADGKAKNTARLRFEPINRVVELKGLFGEMCMDNKVNFSKKA